MASHYSHTLHSELTRNQRRLYALILSLLADVEATEDVLQNTNMVIWQQADKFVEGTDFMAWACQIARNQVLAYIRDSQRDRHVFDDTLIEELAARGQPPAVASGRLSVLLDECLSQCGDEERVLLTQRYAPGASVKQMAAERGMTANKLSIILCRLRRALLECVERKLAREGQT